MTIPPPPIPAVPLGYAPPPREGRPGIVTAIGVASLVVACLGGIASLSGIASGIAFLVMGRMKFPAPPAPVPVYSTSAVGVTAGGMVVDPRQSPNAMPVAQ